MSIRFRTPKEVYDTESEDNREAINIILRQLTGKFNGKPIKIKQTSDLYTKPEYRNRVLNILNSVVRDGNSLLTLAGWTDFKVCYKVSWFSGVTVSIEKMCIPW